MLRKGILIVIEGLDGAGKTTIARWLVDLFNNIGYNALYTYEPTDSLFVKALKSYSEFRSAELDALVYAADRLIHLRSKVLPALEEGKIVVMDRYYFSSIAYQGAQGAPIEWVFELNKYARNPDLAIYIDVEPEIGLMRLSRKEGLSRFPEYEKLELLRRVREIYLELVNRGLLILVDGSKELDTVKSNVLEIIHSAFPFLRSLN